MSGVEAVGLLLGIVPLLVSAIEHYEDVLRPIRRYRAYGSKSQRFCDELETQRNVYQAECQLLLGEFVGPDTAREMLCNPQHPSWREPILSKSFESRLGSLGPTCLSVVSRINSSLKEIDQKFQGLISNRTQSSDVSLLCSHHVTMEQIWLT